MPVRKVCISGDHAVVPLTKGKIAIIDVEDVPMVANRSWQYFFAKGKEYAQTSQNIKGKCKKSFLHRLIMGVSDGRVRVDHRSGDGLDNRRSNLRVCTHQQNQCNLKTRKGRAFKGVGLDGYGGKYKAYITCCGEKYSLGSYPSKEEAAVAYDLAAIALHGEFASLNFPDKDYSTYPSPRLMAPRSVGVGLKGVGVSTSKTNPWSAQIYIKRKKKHLGLFPTKELAHAAYLAAKAEMESN